MENRIQFDIPQKLSALRTEHRELDNLIAQLLESPPYDQIQLQRLKRRKLLFKDEITWLEGLLLPNIIA